MCSWLTEVLFPAAVAAIAVVAAVVFGWVGEAPPAPTPPAPNALVLPARPRLLVRGLGGESLAVSGAVIVNSSARVPMCLCGSVLDPAAQALQANLMAVEDEEVKLLSQWQWRMDVGCLSVRAQAA